jgi:hypothetical protein
MVYSTAELSGIAITNAIERAQGCLRRTFRSVEGASGWYHYLDDLQPGVTASAVGLLTFSISGTAFERTPDVVRYLLSKQKTSADRSDGGWSVRTTNGFPISEATGWTVRALSRPQIGALGGDGLRRGVQWLRANQNTDFGWGSYFGMPSRVFQTAVNMLALQECCGDSEALANAQRWLIDAQSPQLPAWGPLPGSDPTMVHTSMALSALSRIPGALSVNTMRLTAEWLLENLEPGRHVERSTTVEEYDVPYNDGVLSTVFQNSLPHFAGPMALSAIISSGALDPLQTKIFKSIEGIIDTQLQEGHWEIPRSPMRPSIWALWPFVSALSLARQAILTSPRCKATLMFPGCAIVQSEEAGRGLTRGLLIRNAATEWARTRWVALMLWLVSAVATGVPVVLLVLGLLSLVEFLTALIVPVLLMLFQFLWERRPRTGAGRP